jgi:hypothetical protein
MSDALTLARSEIERLQSEIERLRDVAQCAANVLTFVFERSLPAAAAVNQRYGPDTIKKLDAAIKRATEGEPASDACPGWKPIEGAPRDAKVLFWIRPKTDDETWHDTSGKAIKSDGEPHIHEGVYGSWGSLWTATHWMPRIHIAPPGAEPAEPSALLSAAQSAAAVLALLSPELSRMGCGAERVLPQLQEAIDGVNKGGA